MKENLTIQAGCLVGVRESMSDSFKVMLFRLDMAAKAKTLSGKDFFGKTVT